MDNINILIKKSSDIDVKSGSHLNLKDSGVFFIQKMIF